MTVGITPDGNWEGRTILRRVTGRADAAAEARLAANREALLAARAARPRPGRDDKVLADWNGLAISALCRAAAVFGEPAWLDLALAAFGFVTRQMGAADGRVAHAWRLGRVTAAGLLDDQAAMARAALALFEAIGRTDMLEHAVALAEAAIARFAAGDGGFYTTADDATDVPLGPEARPRSVMDQATPAGNGLMAQVFARLHHLTGAPAWRHRAEGVLAAFGGMGEHLSAAPGLLAAADLLEEGTVVVIAGPAGDALMGALWATALASPDPAVCVLRACGDDLPMEHPAHGKTGNQAAAYVCRAGICGRPTHDPAALDLALRTRQTPTA